MSCISFVVFSIVDIMWMFLKAITLIVFFMFQVIIMSINMSISWFMLGMVGSFVHWLMMS